MENEGLNLDGVAITCGLIMGAIASVGGYSSPPLGAAIVTYVFVYGVRRLWRERNHEKKSTRIEN